MMETQTSFKNMTKLEQSRPRISQEIEPLPPLLLVVHLEGQNIGKNVSIKCTCTPLIDNLILTLLSQIRGRIWMRE